MTIVLPGISFHSSLMTSRAYVLGFPSSSTSSASDASFNAAASEFVPGIHRSPAHQYESREVTQNFAPSRIRSVAFASFQ